MLRSLRSVRAVGVPRALARRCSTLSHAVAMRSAAARAVAAAAPRAAAGAATRSVAGAHARAAVARHMSTGAGTYNITVPPLGDSVSDATVAEVRKNVGEAVAMDEIVALMETDKVAVDVRAPEGGAITAINIAKGSVVKVGDVLMTVAKGAVGKASAPAAAAPAASAAPAPAAPKPAAAAAPAAPVAAAAASHGRKPLIQFRYGKANSAKAPAAGASAGAGAGAALTGPAKYRLPVSVFSADVLSLDVSAGERWTGVPDSLRRAPLSDAVIALIELGGAVDPPAPAKAKGGKGGAAKKK